MLDETPSLKLDSIIAVDIGKTIEVHVAGAYKPSEVISFNSSFVGFLSEPVEFKGL